VENMPWWLVAVLGVVGVIAAVLWWKWPKREVKLLGPSIRDAKTRADIEDNFRKSIAQFFGGTVMLIAAGFTYYQAQLTWKASSDQLISQQVSKGFELLGQAGNDKVVVRLGGIYALEGVMNTSEQYHQPVLEALCAFVREGAKADIAEGAPATDIQAALTVIGRRNHQEWEAPLRSVRIRPINLVGAHIPRARLFRSDLNGAALAGTNLTGAYPNRAYLTGANLDGAILTGAQLFDADLRGTDLSQVSLKNAYLVGTIMSDADLTGADLSGANLNGAILTGAHLTGTNLIDRPFRTGADWARRDVNDAYWRANLIGAFLEGADLTGTDVLQSQLDEACGDDKTKLPPHLTIKPCPKR
jgi:hypothetical protein